MAYDVYTTLDPEQANEVAMHTFHRWLEFALGRSSLEGKTLKNPSGRYAASLRVENNKQEHYIGIWADADEAPEANWIEYGKQGPTDLKKTMLSAFNSGVHYAKDGSVYRTIPIKIEEWHGAMADSANSFHQIGSAFGANISNFSAKDSDPDVKFRTMSSKKPGSWIIPPMAAYSPALILSQDLQEKYGV